MDGANESGSLSESLKHPMRALRRDLERLPQNPVARAHPRNWVFRFKRGMDLIGHARPQAARFFRRMNPYPKPFRHKWLRTRDGVHIAAWYGPQETPATDGSPAAFGLVIVPGMFSTKDDSVHKRRALRAWKAWNVPVIIIDQRAFGESKGIGTGGWKEAYDVEAAAKFLRDHANVKRVSVLAESLGGAAALNATALHMEDDNVEPAQVLDGGVVCWSAFVDVLDAVHYISTKPPLGDPFMPQWQGFRRMLRYRSMGGYDSFLEYMDDAARVNGLAGFEELASRANPKIRVPHMDHPVLLVHATNDPVVPVRHARRMERYARDHPNIQVITTNWGAHTGFEAMDPWWYWEVLCRFYGTLNGVDLINPAEELKGPGLGGPLPLRRAFAQGGGGP